VALCCKHVAILIMSFRAFREIAATTRDRNWFDDCRGDKGDECARARGEQ
jgi:hypothetical protein